MLATKLKCYINDHIIPRIIQISVDTFYENCMRMINHLHFSTGSISKVFTVINR